jgi:multidrug efflux pump subunit AcrB
MSQLSTASVVEERLSDHWTERLSRSIIFVVITLVIIGGYLAFTIPVAVFPSTDFPRIVIGVDNGVAPIDQMEVTITRPIEETVNTVPGLEQVRSITSRGSAEINLFFNWKVNMFQTLEYVNAALARIQTSLPVTAKVSANRLTFAAFPIIGYSLTSNTISQTRLWELATYTIKPRLSRVTGVSMVIVQGGQQPEFQIEPDPGKLLQTQVTVPALVDSISKSNLIDSPGLFENNHQLVLTLVSGQARTPAEISNIVVKTTQSSVPVRIGDVATGPLFFSISIANRRAIPLRWPMRCVMSSIRFGTLFRRMSAWCPFMISRSSSEIRLAVYGTPFSSASYWRQSSWSCFCGIGAVHS